jgi:hypothetical protein
MNCLVVEINKNNDTHYDEINEKLVFYMEHYRSFFLKNGIIDKLKSQISILCGTCNSFVVPAAALYDLLHEPDLLFDQEEREEWDDDFDALYETVYSLRGSLTEEIIATDEEWHSYFETGAPKLNPMHLGHDGRIDIPEGANNPVRLKYEDVVFKFGTECKFCGRVF